MEASYGKMTRKTRVNEGHLFNRTCYPDSHRYFLHWRDVQSPSPLVQAGEIRLQMKFFFINVHFLYKQITNLCLVLELSLHPLVLNSL